MKIKIRPANKMDLPTILEIYNHAILNTTAVYSYDPFTPEEMEAWYMEKVNNNFPLLVSTQGDQVTGFVTFGKFRMRPAYKYVMEHSIYVHPSFRRQGIARVLMTRIIQEAKEADIHVLIGGIDAENIISVEFHKEFGFEEVANIKEVGYKFNRWLDLKLLQLILETPHQPNEEL